LRYLSKPSLKPSWALIFFLPVIFTTFAISENIALSEWLKNHPESEQIEAQNRLNMLASDVKKTRDTIYEHMDEGIKRVLTLPKDMSVQTRGDFNKIDINFIYKIY